jgi:hypothetical protein
MPSWRCSPEPGTSPGSTIPRGSRGHWRLVRRWLADRELVGADEVRARMALVLAAELDDPGAPKYARSKVSSELRARLLAELEFSALASAAELVEVDGA